MRLLLLLPLLLLVGCASAIAQNAVEVTQEKYSTYIGRNVDEIIVQVTPIEITDLTSGGKKYDFRTYEDKNFKVICNWNVLTDSDNVIVEVRTTLCSYSF